MGKRQGSKYFKEKEQYDTFVGFLQSLRDRDVAMDDILRIAGEKYPENTHFLNLSWIKEHTVRKEHSTNLTQISAQRLAEALGKDPTIIARMKTPELIALIARQGLETVATAFATPDITAADLVKLSNAAKNLQAVMAEANIGQEDTSQMPEARKTAWVTPKANEGSKREEAEDNVIPFAAGDA